VVRKLVQASQLCGFTRKLSIGSHIGRDATLHADVPPPHWASLIGPTNVALSGGSRADCRDGGEAEIAIDEDNIPREVNVDTELVVQLIERLSTSDNV